MGVSRRSVIWICNILALVIVLYWVAWYSHRSLVASTTGPVYINFEQAFPLADGILVMFMLLSARALAKVRPSALAYLLLAAGGGLYLAGMDVLFDIEHKIWWKGTNGLVELVMNVATLVASVGLGRWAWHRRIEIGR